VCASAHQYLQPQRKSPAQAGDRDPDRFSYAPSPVLRTDVNEFERFRTQSFSSLAGTIEANVRFAASFEPRLGCSSGPLPIAIGEIFEQIRETLVALLTGVEVREVPRLPLAALGGDRRVEEVDFAVLRRADL
jgi:hypothetical protein